MFVESLDLPDSVTNGIDKTFGRATSRSLMDANRKNAYRYLLYWAMLDIRPIAGYRFRPWRFWELPRHLRHTDRAGRIADVMHNLAFAASDDFQRFDEQEFWDAVDWGHRIVATIDPARYRAIFDRRLLELNASQ